MVAERVLEVRSRLCLVMSAEMEIVQPFALLEVGCTALVVKSVLALVLLSPMPTMAVSEIPTGESQGPTEA